MIKQDRKTIVWVHGKKELGGHRFEELGFDVKYFKWDWNGINYVAERSNQEEICSIILPDGYEGNRIQKQMMSKLLRETRDDEHEEDEKVAIQIHDEDTLYEDEDGNLNDHVNGLIGPIFFRWNGDIEQLMNNFKDKNIIKQDRKKIITHTNERNYNYHEWNDISLDYPNFDKHEITKLNVTKTYCLLNNETRNDYNDQKEEFLNMNNKDEYQSFNETMNILGFKNCLTIKKHDSLSGDVDKTPFWFKVYGYWIYSVFLLTLYPRYKASTMFGKCNWKIIKSISI